MAVRPDVGGGGGVATASRDDGVGILRREGQGDGEDGDGDHDHDGDDEAFSFLGYVHPTPSELLGNASRTELYRCRSCSSYTRFPRYNRALWVTSSRRGRCGEYSMLLYRMLRALGYEGVRWVVDWSDHVWVEVRLGGGGGGNIVRAAAAGDGEGDGRRWVHLDPCEAAVDEPLLYESWGKNQTYIVAFHDPFFTRSGNDDDPATTDRSSSGGPAPTGSPLPASSASLPRGRHIDEDEEDAGVRPSRRHPFPPVEDITHRYTSDEARAIWERRGVSEEPVAEAIGEVSRNMVDMLRDVVMQR